MEIKHKSDDLGRTKQSLAECENEIKILRFRLEKDTGVLSESKSIGDQYKNEISSSQMRYLEVKKDLDSSRFTVEEQALLIDQLRKDNDSLTGRLMSRDEEIELLKIKCISLKDEITVVKGKKVDLEHVVNNLADEINQLRQDDEACRKILDRRNQMEKIRNHNQMFSNDRVGHHTRLGSTHRSIYEN